MGKNVFISPGNSPSLGDRTVLYSCINSPLDNCDWHFFVPISLCQWSYLVLRRWVHMFPAWHTKTAPNAKCSEGYMEPSIVRLLYQFQVAMCFSMLEALVLVGRVVVSCWNVESRVPCCNQISPPKSCLHQLLSNNAWMAFMVKLLLHISLCHLLLLSTYFKSYLSTEWNLQLIHICWICYIAISNIQKPYI